MTTTTESPPTERTATPTLPPGRVLTLLAIVWTGLYAVFRAVLSTIDLPVPVSVTGADLVVLAGWPGVVALVLGVAIVSLQAALLRRAAEAPALRWSLIAGGAVITAALTMASALLLLDLIGAVLPGLGVVLFPYGAAFRLGCLLAAALIALHTHRFWSRTRPAGAITPVRTATPVWAWVAGYAAVVGCLVRLAAQAVVGFNLTPFATGPMLVVFEVGFLLAGLLLPLALVHRWGRIWPFWVPGLAGRRVPRWLLIFSGGVLGVGMSSYFGMMVGSMVLERLQGRNPFPPTQGLDLPEPFFWVSVPAYLVWGVGLLVATISYRQLTRR